MVKRIRSVPKPSAPQTDAITFCFYGLIATISGKGLSGLSNDLLVANRADKDLPVLERIRLIFY